MHDTGRVYYQEHREIDICNICIRTTHYFNPCMVLAVITVVRFTKNYLPILWSIKPQMPIRYHSIFESSTYLKNEIMKKRFLFNSSKVGQPEAKSSPKVSPKSPLHTRL